jgi:hypothetical protein
MNLRDYARGKPCMIRVPGWCNNEPETTVLCHYRIAGYSGMGLKNHDVLAAFGCSTCHELVDGQRQGGLSRSQRQVLLCEGVMRTQAYLLERGILQVHDPLPEAQQLTTENS